MHAVEHLCGKSCFDLNVIERTDMYLTKFTTKPACKRSPQLIRKKYSSCACVLLGRKDLACKVREGAAAAASQRAAGGHRLQGSSPESIFSMICRPIARIGRVKLSLQPGAALIGRHGQHLK